MLKNYCYLMRLHKPIGIFLLLWPTWWALWLAGRGHPSLKNMIIFTLGVIVMRSAGCVINDIADRHIDKHVARTRERPITSGKIRVKHALVLFVILMLLALSLALFLNPLSLLFACFGAVFAIGYPFLKRYTHLPQAGLGIAFAWGVPMAFAAQTNAVTAAAWQVFLAAAVWPFMYDTLYAMTDREDDLKIGVKSTAILFGRYDRVIIGLLQIVLLMLLINMDYLFKLGKWYELSVLSAALLFCYQQYLMNKKSYFAAFLNNNWVGAIIFIGILFS